MGTSPSYSGANRSTANATAAIGTNAAKNRTASLFQLMGRSPISFPVCPFVHGEQEVLSVPPGMQHPDGQKGVADVVPFHRRAAAVQADGVVALHRVGQRVLRALPHALFGPGLAFLGVLIVSVGQEARQVPEGKRDHLGIVVGLDRVHMRVGHAGRSVHGDAREVDGSFALGGVMVGLGVEVLAVAPGHNLGHREIGICVGRGRIQPERDVDPLDLVEVVFVREAFGEQLLIAVVLLQRRDGVLFRLLEGDEVVGAQRVCQLAGHDGLVSAVRALLDGGDLIDHQLGPA
ncbi:hypothetical protein JI75_07185 [Berryella intestinalis]|uniref:Uncharacterized protein n=1 Tax=Berryella intestinalis TaxID=1531429 RepID=A0A0A8BBE1_9ACTN|nr:hypothetical protein [Berryella intestinalis]AJC12482.1 hypothetical protein JI75_07185 [Berryella intestinalis]